MHIITSVAEWRKIRQQLTHNIGYVATMGNLHAGHASLLERSRQENPLSVLSIFVNPTQFNEQQDFKNYPRTLSADLALAEQYGMDYVVLPQEQELYADRYTYKIQETSFSELLCGAHRPGHFMGMLTVVLKLLMLIKPKRAYFGEKDFQQLQLIKDMVNAFFIDTEIVGCPIVRDENGVALSSRNNLLTAEEYQLLQHFPRLLRELSDIDAIRTELSRLGFVVDYITEYQGRRLGAVRLGAVRLIDNVELNTAC